MRYARTLTPEQKQKVFNETDNKDSQSKFFSIWQYKIKYAEKNYTTNKLYTLWIQTPRLCGKISRMHFYRIIKAIKRFEIELLTPSFNDECYTECYTECYIDKPTTSIENTDLTSNSNLPKNKDINYNTNTLYTNEVCSPVELICKAMELLKDLNIKSRVVMERVFEKLKKCNKIQRAGMVDYILVVIREKQKQNEVKRENYKKNKPYAPKPLLFNNFDGRNYSDEDYKDIEWKSLGWA